jgi:hypothetical protein
MKVALVAAVTGVALAGCGSAAAPAQSDQTDLSLASVVGDATVEADLLTALDLGGVLSQTDPSPSSGAKGGKGKAHAVRPMLRHKVLHAEAVLGTDNGTRTVDVQHGSVTAIGAASITVKSTDGFVQQYVLTDATKVVAGRQKADIGAVANGAEIGIAGDKAGGEITATLILVPKK